MSSLPCGNYVLLVKCLCWVLLLKGLDNLFFISSILFFLEFLRFWILHCSVWSIIYSIFYCNLELAMASEEVLKAVFPFLDGVDLASCMAVDKQWKDIASDDFLWKCLCAKRWPSICKWSNPSTLTYYNFCWVHLWDGDSLAL